MRTEDKYTVTYTYSVYSWEQLGKLVDAAIWFLCAGILTWIWFNW